MTPEELKREKLKVAVARWRAENPEKQKAINDRYAAKLKLDPVRRKVAAATKARWRAANPEKQKAMNDRQNAVRKSNPAYYRSLARAHYAKNRYNLLARRAKWAADNPQKVKAINAKCYAKYPHRMADWKLANPERARVLRLRIERNARDAKNFMNQLNVIEAVHKLKTNNQNGNTQ